MIRRSGSVPKCHESGTLAKSPRKQRTIPVAVNEAGIDIIAALEAPERLEADPGGLEGENVDQPVLELVHLQVGRDKPARRDPLKSLFTETFTSTELE
jgi:hypothetical protein